MDIALPAEGVSHNLVLVSIKKTCSMQTCRIMHGLWNMGQTMFTTYVVVIGALFNQFQILAGNDAGGGPNA